MNEVKSMSGFINSRLILVTVLSALFASVLSTLYTLIEFDFALEPELLKKANAVAEVIHDDVQLATSVGIPFDQIEGMDSYLSDTLYKYPELTFVAIVSEKNSLLYSAGTTPNLSRIKPESFNIEHPNFLQENIVERLIQGSKELYGIFFSDASANHDRDLFKLEMTLEDKTLGYVLVGLDSGFIQSQLTDVFFDVVIVLVAVLLVCFEVVMVVVMFYVSEPLKESESLLQRQAEGDFSVNEKVITKGVFGNFIGKLNQDSKDLQAQFQSAVQIVEQENVQKTEVSAKSHLQKIAEKFRLQNVLNVKSGDIVDARIPLFVFSLAEELQKSFMPLFVAELYEADSWISKDVMLGLPISIFMLVIALATPFAAGWVDRWGQKPLFLIGLIPAILGYLGCYFAQDAMDIVIARGVTALGYAVITISCQSYIAAVVSSENRAKGMAIFVGVLMTATMCGTALGAIIADRIGYQPVFLLSAILSSFAGVLAWRMFSGKVSTASSAASQKAKGGLLLLARNVKFVCIIIFCAIPTKIILTGFLYFMVPLYLVSLDASQSEIGRVMMVYSLIIIPLSPLASGIADKSGKMKELVLLGTVLSGGILVSLYGEASFYKLLLAVALMGVAHSILKAPLIASALEAAEATPEVGRTKVLGILRTAERIGSVLGPVLVATLLTLYDFGEAMAIVGTGVLVSALCMFIFLRVPDAKQDAGAES
ncbi:MFS transporter [Marinomonas sp. SBI22]|uniref:MFS transporter n=1 Tax=unclassified Marinomonas TaxID=196814 RepID=UPI0007AF2950|nr:MULTISPECIES: MFS transporter [unclassified Marinomonas]KZM40916.1 MFS transporter [Marinomonas sp. SBI22]KZM42756.1 MFS transporter [Marinomonas sp. SBI8L]